MKALNHSWRPALAITLMTLALMLATIAAHGQGAKGPSGSNPTTSSVTEEQLFREMDRLTGRASIPNPLAGTLEQPQGRTYRRFHEGWLPWIGGVAVVGMLLVLAAFYAIRGRIRIAEHERSDRKLLRFGAFERFNHWMMATCFIVLALTGLNYIFGKRLLMPLFGADAFSTWSHWAKFAHNFIAWPFMLALLLMFVVWVKDNLPGRYDWRWIKAGGGLFGGSQPDADRFNAGQKLLFWTVTIGGLLMSASGIVMLFPFVLLDINGMQVAQYVHAVVGILMIAVILAHIYIGSLGMEGALAAMTTGEVDLAWAQHHHRIWVDEQLTHPTGQTEVGGVRPSPA